MVTDVVIREEKGKDFIHAIVLTNERNEALVAWYNSPSTSH